MCYDFCQSQLKEGIMTSAQHKLEAVLNKWIESQCSEVSWNHLIQVLIDMELVDVAEEVRRYLQTDHAISKYRHGMFVNYSQYMYSIYIHVFYIHTYTYSQSH